MMSVFNQNLIISYYFCHPVAHATDLLIKLWNYNAQDGLYVQQLTNFHVGRLQQLSECSQMTLHGNLLCAKQEI